MKTATKSNRGPGRPPSAIPLEKRIYVKVTKAEHDWLSAMAKSQGRTITEVIRRSVFAAKT